VIQPTWNGPRERGQAQEDDPFIHNNDRPNLEGIHGGSRCKCRERFSEEGVNQLTGESQIIRRETWKGWLLRGEKKERVSLKIETGSFAEELHIKVTGQT